MEQNPQLAGGCVPICGDGIVRYDYNEQCDDNNQINGDGCSTTCEIETGFICGSPPA